MAKYVEAPEEKQGKRKRLFLLAAFIAVFVIGIIVFIFLYMSQVSLPVGCSFVKGVHCDAVLLAVNSSTGAAKLAVLATNMQPYPLANPKLYASFKGKETYASECSPSLVGEGGAILCILDAPSDTSIGESMSGSLSLNASVCQASKNASNCTSPSSVSYNGNFNAVAVSLVSSSLGISVSPKEELWPADGSYDAVYASVNLFGHPMANATVLFLPMHTYAKTNSSGVAVSYASSSQPANYTVNASFVNVSASTVIHFLPYVQISIYVPQKLLSFPGSTAILMLNGNPYTLSQLGTNETINGHAVLKLDVIKGSNAVINFLEIGNSTTRFIAATSSASFTALSNNVSINPNYQLQYYLNESANGGGRVLPGSNWYNNSSVVEISAVPQQGWVFTGWSGFGVGSYTGTAVSQAIQVLGPITEKASFYQSSATTSVPITTTTTPQIYCIGGKTGNSTATSSVYYANATAYGINSWQQVSAYPFKMSGASCFIYYGYIYCIGGINYTSLPLAYSANVYISKIYGSGSIGSWQPGNSYPMHISNESCVAYNSTVYCIGGINGLNATNYVYYAKLLNNGQISNWTNTTSYPHSLSDMSCVASYGNVYCIGGYNAYTKNSTSAVYSASITNKGLSEWKAIASYPIKVYGESCLAYNSTIYCTGGISNGTATNASYAFVKGRWVPIPSYPVGISRQSCTLWRGFVNSSIFSKAYIYCIGGTEKSGKALPSGLLSNSIYYAQITSNSTGNWMRTASYPINATGLSCEAFPFTASPIYATTTTTTTTTSSTSTAFTTAYPTTVYPYPTTIYPTIPTTVPYAYTNITLGKYTSTQCSNYTNASTASCKLPSLKFYNPMFGLCGAATYENLTLNPLAYIFTGTNSSADFSPGNVHICSASSSSNDAVVGGIYIYSIENTKNFSYIAGNATNAGNYTLEYNFSNSASCTNNAIATLLIVSCGTSACSSISVPEYCSMVVNQTGNDSHESVSIYKCNQLSNVSYFVFANSLSKSNISITVDALPCGWWINAPYPIIPINTTTIPYTYPTIPTTTIPTPITPTTTIIYYPKYCMANGLSPTCLISNAVSEGTGNNTFWLGSSASYGAFSTNWPVFAKDQYHTVLLGAGTAVTAGAYYNGGYDSDLGGINVFSKKGWQGFVEQGIAQYGTSPTYVYTFNEWNYSTPIAVLLLAAWGAGKEIGYSVPANCSTLFSYGLGSNFGMMALACNQTAGVAYNLSLNFAARASSGYAAIAFPYGRWGSASGFNTSTSTSSSTTTVPVQPVPPSPSPTIPPTPQPTITTSTTTVSTTIPASISYLINSGTISEPGFYCIGGGDIFTNKNITNAAYYSILENNGIVNWTPTTPYPYPVASPSCAAINGFIYCTGGFNENTGNETDLSFYTDTTPFGLGPWVEAMPYPQSVVGTSCVAVATDFGGNPNEAEWLATGGLSSFLPNSLMCAYVSGQNVYDAINDICGNLFTNLWNNYLSPYFTNSNINLNNKNDVTTVSNEAYSQLSSMGSAIENTVDTLCSYGKLPDLVYNINNIPADLNNVVSGFASIAQNAAKKAPYIGCDIINNWEVTGNDYVTKLDNAFLTTNNMLYNDLTTCGQDTFCQDAVNQLIQDMNAYAPNSMGAINDIANRIPNVKSDVSNITKAITFFVTFDWKDYGNTLVTAYNTLTACGISSLNISIVGLVQTIGKVSVAYNQVSQVPFEISNIATNAQAFWNNATERCSDLNNQLVSCGTFLASVAALAVKISGDVGLSIQNGNPEAYFSNLNIDGSVEITDPNLKAIVSNVIAIINATESAQAAVAAVNSEYETLQQNCQNLNFYLSGDNYKNVQFGLYGCVFSKPAPSIANAIVGGIEIYDNISALWNNGVDLVNNFRAIKNDITIILNNQTEIMNAVNEIINNYPNQGEALTACDLQSAFNPILTVISPTELNESILSLINGVIEPINNIMGNPPTKCISVDTTSGTLSSVAINTNLTGCISSLVDELVADSNLLGSIQGITSDIIGIQNDWSIIVQNATNLFNNVTAAINGNTVYQNCLPKYSFSSSSATGGGFKCTYKVKSKNILNSAPTVSYSCTVYTSGSTSSLPGSASGPMLPVTQDLYCVGGYNSKTGYTNAVYGAPIDANGIGIAPGGSIVSNPNPQWMSTANYPYEVPQEVSPTITVTEGCTTKQETIHTITLTTDYAPYNFNYPFKGAYMSCVALNGSTYYNGYLWGASGLSWTLSILGIFEITFYASPKTVVGIGSGGLTQLTASPSNIFCIGGYDADIKGDTNAVYTTLAAMGGLYPPPDAVTWTKETLTTSYGQTVNYKIPTINNVWASTTSYPIAVQGMSCGVATFGSPTEYLPYNSAYIYCVGGYNVTTGKTTSSAYFAHISITPKDTNGNIYFNDKIDSWQGTSSYPINVSDLSCSVNNQYIYCTGGLNSNLSPVNVSYYAPITPYGIETWINTTSYPFNVSGQACVASPQYYIKPFYESYLCPYGDLSSIQGINVVTCFNWLDALKAVIWIGSAILTNGASIFA